MEEDKIKKLEDEIKRLEEDRRGLQFEVFELEEENTEIIAKSAIVEKRQDKIRGKYNETINEIDITEIQHTLNEDIYNKTKKKLIEHIKSVKIKKGEVRTINEIDKLEIEVTRGIEEVDWKILKQNIIEYNYDTHKLIIGRFEYNCDICEPIMNFLEARENFLKSEYKHNENRKYMIKYINRPKPIKFIHRKNRRICEYYNCQGYELH